MHVSLFFIIISIQIIINSSNALNCFNQIPLTTDGESALCEYQCVNVTFGALHGYGCGQIFNVDLCKSIETSNRCSITPMIPGLGEQISYCCCDTKDNCNYPDYVAPTEITTTTSSSSSNIDHKSIVIFIIVSMNFHLIPVNV